MFTPAQTFRHDAAAPRYFRAGRMRGLPGRLGPLEMTVIFISQAYFDPFAPLECWPVFTSYHCG